MTPGAAASRVLRMADYRARTRAAGADGAVADALSTGVRPIEPTRSLTARDVAHRERMLSHLGQLAGRVAR